MKLDVEQLTIAFPKLKAVRNVSFSLEQGEALAIVGESGSGKSITARALLNLLPSSARIEGGRILYDGVDLLRLPAKVLRSFLGRKIGFVSQDSMSSLNPTMKIGSQIAESLIFHKLMDKKSALQRAEQLLHLVGIPEASLRLSAYPHQLSGGMRQRVSLAAALASTPSLLIADEPTTALDSKTQSQILALLDRFRREFNMSLILITHDLEIVENICEKILVLYAGSIVEQGTVREVFTSPQHPYTEMLLRSLPRLTAKQGEPLPIIEGAPPNLQMLPPGCPFAERCPYVMDLCRERHPPLVSKTACWKNHA